MSVPRIGTSLNCVSRDERVSSVDVETCLRRTRRYQRYLRVLSAATLFSATTLADEAPTGFDDQTNGFLPQAIFNGEARRNFEQVQTVALGLGPLYNARSCAECHANPVDGGGSAQTQLRVGHFDGTTFSAPPGGSLIRDRATDASIQSHVPSSTNVRATRIAPSALGDGFVEALPDDTLVAIASAQPGQSGGSIHGEAVWVDVVEAPGVQRVGRFGWKATHASLLSFTADAARDEMGITSSLFPSEATANGRSVARYDKVHDPEDRGVVIYGAQFLRSTKAPPRDDALAGTPAAQAGEALFADAGCSICHVVTLTTAPVGTVINGGHLQVPESLGDKTIHPYSDFLLHDVGTGDGIVQNGSPSSRNKIRTAPLWGLRGRSRLLHDGSVLTVNEAIQRHHGEAERVTRKFRALSREQKYQMLRFLNSL